ncbi:sulfate/molybdate ABC transporter ATP-binding protein [Candidatus Contubernalis alkaliaceticus]|uniref:sulfate/molybdate ABC transporter ATP-binding protein n=1 Tax=Candidatus Contubernalis alkaliaceticus TaxID=338645 RepID=UPI001F4BF7D7|nr:ATP-binding cassette domain-containing protein [Candidatus Contubernalis alkalaceticus]UNC92656.1 ATP-binding cassette domain-containing protein [Candidatus Contubernalis alkalaceticus]
MLKIKINKKFGCFKLQKEWSVDKGEVITLLGPSGAGKSLTLKCIAGLIEPELGKITVDDQVLLDTGAGINLSARKRKIGYVPQNYALFPHLSVAANVSFGLQERDRGVRELIIEQLLQSVGLVDLKHKFPGQLSGGEKQRVSLIRAIAAKPRVLLLDEPFTAVDAPMRQILRDEVKDFLRNSNIPVVLVTHDPQDVSHLEAKVCCY